MREAAEREARRWHRVARRERAVADDELQQLEEMGGELLQRVRLHRASIRVPDTSGDGPVIEARDLRKAPRAGQRARLRDSPLAGLFAATDRRPGPREPAPPAVGADSSGQDGWAGRDA